jgi:HPt (histidine-containing phosphotransfer) domain-containing protein
LVRWLAQTAPAPVDATSDPSVRATPVPSAPGSVLRDKPTGAAVLDPINPRALDAIRQLPGPNGALLVHKVVAAYLADTSPRFAQLRAAVEAGDAEALRKAAHALKSSSANVGAEKLAALCKELEMIGRKGTVDGAKTLLEDVESGFPCVLAALQVIINRSSRHAIV